MVNAMIYDYFLRFSIKVPWESHVSGGIGRLDRIDITASQKTGTKQRSRYVSPSEGGYRRLKLQSPHLPPLLWVSIGGNNHLLS